jgi:hypothetical protein
VRRPVIDVVPDKYVYLPFNDVLIFRFSLHQVLTSHIFHFGGMGPRKLVTSQDVEGTTACRLPNCRVVALVRCEKLRDVHAGYEQKVFKEILW